MTEKRYKRLVSSIDYYYCIDTTNDDKGLTEEDMLNLLNKQDKTIKELGREKKSFMGDAIKFEKECKRLYNNLRLTNSDLYFEKLEHTNCKKENKRLTEENEQLQQSFDKSLLSHTKTCDEYRILSKKNKRLTEENKQLKQFQQEVARVIESKMGDNICNDYKIEVLKEIWDELNLDEVWFE